MTETLQQLKMMFRDDFVPAMFLLVVGTIALVFIGYLLIDYVRTLMTISKIKRRHREESRH